MRRPDGTKVLTTIVVLVAIATIAAAFFIQNNQYDSLLGLYAKQQHQLVSNGIKPSGPSLSQLAKTGPTGPAGAIGATGPRGDTGYTGASGAVGSPGASGAVGGVGVTGSNGPTGAAGTPGQAGAQGQPGTAGADGAPGAPGTAGQPGSPVYSWTYINAAGLHKQCNRDVPFDPLLPTYTCVSIPTPTP